MTRDIVTGGSLDIEVSFDGLRTVVTATLTDPEGGSLQAEGEARCRKDDHYVASVGADIAAGRALQGLGTALEELGTSRSESQTSHLQREAAEALGRLGAWLGAR